jgi:hypothetical protein
MASPATTITRSSTVAVGRADRATIATTLASPSPSDDHALSPVESFHRRSATYRLSWKLQGPCGAVGHRPVRWASGSDKNGTDQRQRHGETSRAGDIASPVGQGFTSERAQVEVL